ncbi:hypothetical protein L7F22_053077 [Adiantum nelumboides]|nr:hypothetical protein [Adiantum nelumboides]
MVKKVTQQEGSSTGKEIVKTKAAIKAIISLSFTPTEKELLKVWGLEKLEAASRLPLDINIVSSLPSEKEDSHTKGSQDTRGKAPRIKRQEVVKTPSRASGSKDFVAFGHGTVNDDKVKAHVHEQPPVSIGRRQPSTHGLVNGQDSNEQVMVQTIPLPTSNAGCFGGGSVVQAMIRPSPGLHGFMTDNAYGAMQAGINNPMYGNIGVQPAWITNTFEVDVLTAWNQLSAVTCEYLEEYNAKFWDALLPVSSFKMVTLEEQIEKYCCGLPKGIKKYCTKTSVMHMAQLMENAEVADDMIQGKPDEDGFKTRRKEPQGRPFSAKGNVTSRLTVPPFKKKPFAGRHFANECPQRNSQDKDDKSDHKGNRPKPNAGLVPDLVGDQQNVHATELCKAWGKVRDLDQQVLIFFDSGAPANFISPELALKLGIRAEEMGMTGEAAFKHLKEKLTSDPVIILLDLLKPFVVQCDACGNSLGAVLMQDGRVVAYESKVFSDRKRTLQIYEKEMLAVMHALYS